MLESGELDLGLTGKPEQLRNLTFSPLKEIQDTFVTSREYLENLSLLLGTPMPGLLTPKDSFVLLKSGTLMLLEKDNLTRQYLDQHLKSNQLFPENILETTSMDLLIDFARIGLGIACVIREFVETELQEGSLLELPAPFPIDAREIGFLFQPRHTQVQFIQDLIHQMPR